MLATFAPLTLVLLAAELPDANTGASAHAPVAAAAAAPDDAGPVVAGLRQRPSTNTPKRGIHELKDPGGWPAEPPAVTSAGIGLLQIKPSMFAAGARLPFPRADLQHDKLLDPAHNLQVGAALLAMWEVEHRTIDRA